MNCATAEQKILLDRTGELDGKERESLKEHLRECVRCRDYHDRLPGLESALRRGLPAGDPAPACVARILHEAARPSGATLLHFPVALRILASAAALAIVVGGAWWFRPSAPPDAGPAPHLENMRALVAVAATRDEDSLAVETALSHDDALRDLARQLLHLEGFSLDVDDVDPLDSDLTSDAAPQPTALQGHSRPVFRPAGCV